MYSFINFIYLKFSKKETSISNNFLLRIHCLFPIESIMRERTKRELIDSRGQSMVSRPR